jgi:hypothetical protein
MNGRAIAVAVIALAAMVVGLGPVARAEVPENVPLNIHELPLAPLEIPAPPPSEEGEGEFAEPTAVEAPGLYPIRYNGGSVQHRPYVHLIFWGSDWSKRPEERERLINLYRWINGSSYAGILTQYFDQSGYVGKEVDLSSYTDTRVAHPTNITVATIEQEVAYSINNISGWGPANLDGQYTVIPAPGFSANIPDRGCGFHGYLAAYGTTFQFLPPGSPGSQYEACKTGGVPASVDAAGYLQSLATHEFAETATDPIGKYFGGPGSGWNNGKEISIADACAAKANTVNVAPGIWVQKLHDNFLAAFAQQDCVAQDQEPTRFQLATGTPTTATPHTAVLGGWVLPAGYRADYQFSLSGGGTEQAIPASPGLLGAEFGSVPVSATASVKGQSTYSVKLSSVSELTTSELISGQRTAMSGGTIQFTTPDWRPKLSNVGAAPGNHSVVLSGTIDGQGEGTKYRFEYGHTTAYGASIPAPDGTTAASATNVSHKVEGSEEFEGTYHYRLVATNGEGTTFGADQTFYVQERPTVVAEEPAEVTPDGGKLAVSVNPHGAATTYFFEYGKTASYSSKTATFNAGSATTAATVTAPVTGLEFGTTYHYRFIAENSAGKRVGPDQVFTPGWRRGSVPTSPVSGTSANLNAVACPSATNCFAVGNTRVPQGQSTGPIVDRFDGANWTTQELPNIPPFVGEYKEAQGVLNGIACPSASNCIAVGRVGSTGYLPESEIWNGSTWSPQPMPYPSVNNLGTIAEAVSCPAANFCFAAGSRFAPRDPKAPNVYALDPYIAKWDGSKWTEVTLPLHNPARLAQLKSISCSSTTNCWAVGHYATGTGPNFEYFSIALRWNGTSWTEQDLPKVAGSTALLIRSVSCVSSGTCIAVGFYQDSAGSVHPYILRWDGTQWKVESVSGPGGLLAISCTEVSGLACEATGESTFGAEGLPAAYRLRSGGWDVQALPIAVANKPQETGLLNGVSCFSEGECTAVGQIGQAPGGLGQLRPYAATYSKTAGGAPAGPTAAWAFDEGTGTSAKDAVATHNATLTAPTWVEGKFGKAISFNGTSSCASVPNTADLQLNGPFSLEAWVKPTNVTQWAPIFFKESESFYGYSLFFGAFEAGHVQGYTSKKAGEYAEVESPEKLTANTWAQVAMTSDGTTLRLYVNGKQVDTGPASAVMESKGPLLIGCAKNFGEFFAGSIDNARVYNRTLTAAEVEANKSAAVTPPPPPPPGGATAAYSFNEGAGTAINDSAGSHNGTVAFPTWIEGKFGKAIQFDGEGTCVSVPNSVDLQLSGSFTLEAQVNPANTTQEFAPIFFKESESFYGYSLFFGAFEAGHIQGYVADKPWEYTEVESPEKLVANTWTDVAMTSDGTTLRLYVNGKQTDTASAKAAMESKGPLLIGCGKSLGAEFFKGKIDNVRIYPRALSGAEIETNKGTGI